MTRTDKHRPGWVQASEHGTEEWHRHELFGAPVIVQRRVRDARGNITKVQAPIRISIAQALILHPPLRATPEDEVRVTAVRKLARQLRSAGAPLTQLIDGPYTRTQTLTQDVVIGHYADHCTIEADYDRDGRLTGQSDIYAPCERTLDWVDRRTTWGRPRGARGYGRYRDHREPTRRRLRSDNRRLTVLADSGSDPDEGLGVPRS